jgi:hypothetical protein
MRLRPPQDHARGQRTPVTLHGPFNFTEWAGSREPQAEPSSSWHNLQLKLVGGWGTTKGGDRRPCAWFLWPRDIGLRNLQLKLVGGRAIRAVSWEPRSRIGEKDAWHEGPAEQRNRPSWWETGERAQLVSAPPPVGACYDWETGPCGGGKKGLDDARARSGWRVGHASATDQWGPNVSAIFLELGCIVMLGSWAGRWESAQTGTS